MAIIGITLNRQNPEFTSADFIFWMPQFKNYIITDEGQLYFNKIYKLVNGKIFKSIYGSDWELAMSYAIAHYLTLIAQQSQSPSGDTLNSIAGGGVTRGILSSASIGSFSKSYDIGLSSVSSDESKFWNQTSYGQSLMTLLKTKAVPSMFVVTSGEI